MNTLRIGWLLARRQLQRANRWTTLLIIFVMMLTFLNLIVVSGVLVGLITGAERAVQSQLLGDIILSERDDQDRILETTSITKRLSTYPEVAQFSARYSAGATLEANYRERRDLTGERDLAQVTVTGIDPHREEAFSGLSNSVVRGDYLDPAEEGYILIGAYYTEEYAENFGDIFDSLSNIEPGSTVRLSTGRVSKEFIVKGIVEAKVDEISLNTYIPEREFRRLFGRLDRNANQIVMHLTPDTAPDTFAATLRTDLGEYAKVQTYDEGKPKFITDIKNTMNLLGTFIGSIGIVVASITIFIIIFINALSRRQQIGILKGIGVERRAIQVAYVLQAAFYAAAGSLLGAVVTYGFLLGYFERNPINFPFSDGILVAPPEETLVRFIVLFAVTLVAGLVPAWIIVRQNTLNSILGRS